MDTSKANDAMAAQPIKHFLQFSDFTFDEFEYVIERAKVIKRKFKAYEVYHPLVDRTLVMVFEKSSTRTRLSFEAGMHQLGGAAIYLNTRDSQLGRGEPVEDAAQVMSRMCDIIMVRTFGQDIIERFAANSRVPVINGLTNEDHPCQVLADIFTFYEHRGPIAGKTVAWIGDANNMLYSWLQAAEVFGFHLNISTPKGYDLDPALVSTNRYILRRNGVTLADYLTVANAFNYTAPTQQKLGILRVDLPVNVKPSETHKTWRLVSDIVLRNTRRLP